MPISLVMLIPRSSSLQVEIRHKKAILGTDTCNSVSVPRIAELPLWLILLLL